MRMKSTRRASKKAVNLTVSSELLVSAKRHDINLSAALESALTSEIKALERQRWLKTNRAGFEAYNAWVEENGAFGDAVRTF
jgi:antitoxin CcdA